VIPSYKRLAGAAIVLAIGLVVLWQAGVLSKSDDGGSLNLTAADTSIDTPPAEGYDIGLEVGDLAPDFEFSSIDGERQRLSDYRGQPVLINFWATWCLPCRSEMPDIQAAEQRYADDNVAVLAINQGDPPSAIQGWVNDLKLQLTAFGYDPKGSVYDRYFNGGVPGLPVSYFVDGTGVITQVVFGPLRDSDLDFALPKTIAGYSPKQD
jgi:thiol-disulfide isomerase/thioredoxin